MHTLSSSLFSCSPLIGGGLSLTTKPKPVRLRPASAKNDKYGSDFGGGLVDQSMTVLRKRIHDMEVAEHNYAPPSHWAEWEKQCYATYGADVCAFVGLVQTLLMNTRPGVAIGLAGLTAMCVPASAILIWAHLVEVLRTGVLGG